MDTGTSSSQVRRWSIPLAVVVVAALVTTGVVVARAGGEVPGTAAGATTDGVSDVSEPAPADRDRDEDAADGLAEGAAEREAEQRAEEEARAAEEEARAAEEAARQAEEEARAAEEAERQAEEEARAAEEARRQAEEEARAAHEALVGAQERLKELGYLVGAADGELGQQTRSAIMAFQAVNGLAVDGALGPQTFAALEGSPREPSLRGGPSTRIEVDMDLQVLHLVEGDRRVTTMKTSTGRGGTFQTQDGQTLRAETPIGTFTIDRRIRGEHQSSYGIGGMWDPMYFHGPWAIHGSPNVPAGPASSGCVRLAMADGRWLFERVPNGTAVVLYGGTHVFTP